MKKEEVLEMYRNEGVDEGKEHINYASDNYGFYALCGMSMLLMLYQIHFELPFGDIPAALFAFTSIGGFARYKTEKNKTTLLLGIFTGIMCLICLGWYIFKTI